MKAFTIVASALLTFASASAASAQQPAGDTKAAFDQNCKACHGARGLPSQAMVKMMKVPRLDAAYFAAHSDSQIVDALKKGKGPNMKSFAGKLTPEQMSSMAKYIRDLAAPVSEK